MKLSLLQRIKVASVRSLETIALWDELYLISEMGHSLKQDCSPLEILLLVQSHSLEVALGIPTQIKKFTQDCCPLANADTSASPHLQGISDSLAELSLSASLSESVYGPLLISCAAP